MIGKTPGVERIAGATAVTLAMLSPAASSAQQGEAKHLTLLGIPSATVAPANLGFASISATTDRAGTADGADGSLAFGLGLGDADTGIGVQVTGYVTSLSDDFGDSGYFEVKGSRRIVGGNTPVYASLTLGSLGTWGDSTDRDTSATLAVTAFSAVRFSPAGDAFPVMFTLGGGSNVRDDDTDPGLFLGAGIGLTPHLGASLAWGGDYVNLGASFKVDGLDNIGLTATVYDLFDQEDSRRLTLSATYLFSDLFPGLAR